MLVYIVRHGETIWNQNQKTQGTKDVSLSSTGIDQACLLAVRLETESISRIYCSDLKRAYETAALVGEKLNIMPVSDPLLREVCFGDWEGLTLKEIESKFPGELDKWRLDHSFCPSGNGESILSVLERVQLFLSRYFSLENQSHESVLVVCHALTAKLLIALLLKLDIMFIWKMRIDNAALNILDIQPQRQVITTLNDVSHLKGL
jgi:broad specificity phosphatase PhoE